MRNFGTLLLVIAAIFWGHTIYVNWGNDEFFRGVNIAFAFFIVCEFAHALRKVGAK